MTTPEVITPTAEEIDAARAAAEWLLSEEEFVAFMRNQFDLTGCARKIAEQTRKAGTITQA